MPMKYDPDTGIPRYVPDLGEELEEGVTPAPIEITSKSAVFKGDKPLTKEAYENLRDGKQSLSTQEADKLLDEIVAKATPAKLDKDTVTDEELDELERMANAASIPGWPVLRRLINRLRLAEGK